MATNTYTALRTTTVSTPVTSVTLDLTGITGYTDLILVDNSKTSSASIAYYLTFNGDTTSGLYSTTYMFGDGSSTTSARVSGQNFIYTSRANSTNGMGITHIQNYSNNTTYKSTLGRGNDTDYIFNWCGLWRNTAPITSITMNANGNNIVAGSTFTLYGVTAAPAFAAKATGGTISYGADGYIYHTFTSSGTFTPSVPLTCDYLVVAGGGGSGGWYGGGGGAGGLRSTVGYTGGGGALESALALSATGYTVTVGAGGSAESNGSDSVFSTITSLGGGSGGSYQTSHNATSGGSGGGGGGYTPITANAAGTTGQGYASGSGFNGGVASAGGGGGAGQAGSNNPGTNGYGGNGGNGVQLTQFANVTGTGVATYYAGGGGGGTTIAGGNGVVGGTGGYGGGGAGQHLAGANGTVGTANTGGGAGGSGYYNNGVAGGSGIVIIRYAN